MGVGGVEMEVRVDRDGVGVGAGIGEGTVAGMVVGVWGGVGKGHSSQQFRGCDKK